MRLLILGLQPTKPQNDGTVDILSSRSTRRNVSSFLLLLVRMLLVAMPGAPSSFLLLVAMPFVGSFLFLVVRPGAPT